MLTLEGHTQGVYVTLTHASIVSQPQAQAQVTLEGFAGDVHAGLTRPSDGRTQFYPRGTPIRNSRQVSLVSTEELALIAAGLGLGTLPAEWLGANLLLSGLPHLTFLPPNTRLFFPGGAVLLVSGENKPCVEPGKVLQAHYPELPDLVNAFVKAGLHRRGLVATVERAGVIAAGDTLRAEIPDQVLYSAL